VMFTTPSQLASPEMFEAIREALFSDTAKRA